MWRRRTLDLRSLVTGGRDAWLLAASVVVPRVTGLATVPIFTRVLGPEDFGRYELLTSILALLYAVCLLGMDFALSVRYFAEDEKQRRRDASAALVAAGTASIIASIVLVAVSGIVGPGLLQSADGPLPFAIVAATVPFNVLGGVLAMSLRLRFMGAAFFRAMLGGAIGGTTGGLVLVLAAKLGLLGALIGLAAVHVLTFAILAWEIRRRLDRPSVDGAVILDLVRLGAPLVPAGAASWAFALADRFFVAAFLPIAQLGLYAAAARLATVLALIQFGFHAAWGPIALRWASSADRDVRYAASLELVAVIGGAAAASVSWLAPLLLWILAGPDYVDAHSVVWLLASGVLFSAMFYVVQIGANIAQRGGEVARALVLAGLINTAANLLLIPALGIHGAGIATLVTYILAYAIMNTMSQRVMPIAIRFGAATAWAIAWTTIAGASEIVPEPVRPAGAVAVVIAAAWISLSSVARLAPVLAAPLPTGSQPEQEGSMLVDDRPR